MPPATTADKSLIYIDWLWSPITPQPINLHSDWLWLGEDNKF